MEVLIYSRRQAAEALSVSLPTFDRIRRTPGFPIAKVGGRVMVPKKALEKWIEETCANSYK